MARLFEITVQASKTFYVQADSKNEALDSEIVSNEMTWGFHEFDYEATDAKAVELNDKQALTIRHTKPELIAQGDD